MIPLFKVRMAEEASDAVTKVLNSGFIGQGKGVEQFEDLLWEELGTDVRPITVNSCTSAIDLALHLCDVGPGDEVISTPQTCFASQVGMLHRHAVIIDRRRERKKINFPKYESYSRRQLGRQDL
jgi:dTDP-4-amino-4,6-dideoxygalactose transaminase